MVYDDVLDSDGDAAQRPRIGRANGLVATDKARRLVLSCAPIASSDCVDRGISRKISGIDTALEFGERHHWHYFIPCEDRTAFDEARAGGCKRPCPSFRGAPLGASPESITTTGSMGFRARAKWRIHDVHLPSGNDEPSPLPHSLGLIHAGLRGDRMDIRTPSTTHLTDARA